MKFCPQLLHPYVVALGVAVLYSMSAFALRHSGHLARDDWASVHTGVSPLSHCAQYPVDVYVCNSALVKLGLGGPFSGSRLPALTEPALAAG